MTKPLLLLIDGHSLAFRCYYAFSKSRSGALRTSTGIPTSICYGFLNALERVIENQKPTSVAIAFDLPKPTFRHDADENYKANRSETPDDFVPDYLNLRELLTSLNVTQVTAEGYEADDVLATLAHHASEAGQQVKILTGDRDLFQLVSPEKNTSILYLDTRGVKSGTYQEFDPEAVEEKLGVLPEQVIDFKALAGDSSDNYKGVKGIGEKTAIKLIKEFGTLDNIYANLDNIKGATKKKLIEDKESAYHCQKLARISLEAPFDIPLDELHLKGFEVDKAVEILTKLELKKFIQNIGKLQQTFGAETIEIPAPAAVNLDNSQINAAGNEQLSIFASPATETTASKSAEPAITEDFLKPQIIDTPKKLDDLVNLLKTKTDANDPVAWDTETTGLDPREVDLVGIGCGWGLEPTDVAYIPVSHTAGEQLPREEIYQALQPILADKKYPKVFQNAKFDRAIFNHQGLDLNGVVFDTMLASYVLQPESKHNLTDLSLRYIGNIVAKSYKDLGLTKKQTIADLDIPTAANYCGLDVYTTYALVEKLKDELEKVEDVDKLLREVELPLEPVLYQMESNGIRIDLDYLQELSSELGEDLEKYEERVENIAGRRFNLNSPKQLGEVLFDELGFDTKGVRKTKTGAYSTNQAVLEKLHSQTNHPSHKIIDYILEYRTLAKLKSTYVDALPTLVSKKTGCVHTDFNQTITSTGRLSSSNPNLQNIPIRTEFSKRIRKAFIPRDGWILAAADYSQIELRILTHLSQEPTLLNAYNTGGDVHRVTAQLIFEKDTPEDVTTEERRLGKIINFGVIYGMGSQRFAREAGVPKSQGKEFIERYHERYSKVFEYLELVKKQAIAQGYVTTILNRRRNFNFASQEWQKLKGSDPLAIDLEVLQKKNRNYNDIQALRAAANAPIQGSSADIIKVAMIQIHELLKDYEAKLLLQVHDELVFEMPPEEWDELQAKIKLTMENAVSLSIPLVVEINRGANWMEAK
ncbi:DNA polymerase I [[Limnothrix rosea] IAM M-220]|uniref:DNA polymerase I n=1 Tax=[Limnothrix rosea] IAM M-220 TaxID=454133 RepID=UPI000962B327|nr:DNA polymerase I [[Limnothrix rosea] IAM M-220]OKH18618.1 DNA polymerase I [[Limnothrix rosea] IAM M-220]